MFDFEKAIKMNPKIVEGKSLEEIDELRKVAEPLGAMLSDLFEANGKKKTEELKMQTIRTVKVEMGEECKVKVLEYPGFYGGCGTPNIEEKME